MELTTEKAPGIVAFAREEELRLVSEARGGCGRAFERLYRAHVGRIYALCLRMAGNRSAAEDLTQEAFVRAWEKLGTFRGDSAFGTWLWRLAVNVALTRLKKKAWEIVEEGGRATAGIHESAGAGRSDLRLRLDLEEAIAKLPEASRMVFVLHDVEGYRHQEIAEQAEIAVGTSKAHLHRARSLLRRMLAT